MTGIADVTRGSKFAYRSPAGGLLPEKRLVAMSETEGGTCVFFEDLQVARLKPSTIPMPGVLYIEDATVSSRHCVISQDAYGRCFVRDTSRNGTWIEGRRVVPGIEAELLVGQCLCVGQGNMFRLEGERAELPEVLSRGTLQVSAPAEVTIVIGDIRGYTTLVTEVDTDRLQRCVATLFRRLQQTVTEYGGTVKEYPGDAVMAYWESDPVANSSSRACRAALALDEASGRLARDPTVWNIPTHPLRLEWALATGLVSIQALGDGTPVGLSMVGEPVIKAYRLEKLADDATGTILACGRTRSLAGHGFCFVDLGEKRLDGFPAPEPVFALTGAE